MPIKLFFKPINEKDSSSSTLAKLKKDDQRFRSSNIANKTVNNNLVNIVEKAKYFEQLSIYRPHENSNFPKTLTANSKRQCQSNWIKTFP